MKLLRLACLVSLYALLCAQLGHALPVALHPCSLPGVQRRALCGAVERLENPDLPGSRRPASRRPASRTLEIHLAVIPAAAGHAHSDPIVPLLGGPGESAIEAAPFLSQLGNEIKTRK